MIDPVTGTEEEKETEGEKDHKSLTFRNPDETDYHLREMEEWEILQRV